MPVMKAGPGRALVGGGGETYDQKVLATGPIAYWPQSETAGVTAHCLVNPLQDGTYTGVTLADDLTGPFGTPAPFYDGANDYLNVLTATLGTAFNKDEHTISMWAKMANAGVWTDGLRRVFMSIIGANAGNATLMRKDVANTQFLWYAAWQGSLLNHTRNPIAETGWMYITITRSVIANSMQAYYQGAVEGAPVAAIAANVAPLTVAMIGASTIVPSDPAHAWIGPVAIWNRVLPQGTITALYNC